MDDRRKAFTLGALLAVLSACMPTTTPTRIRPSPRVATETSHVVATETRVGKRMTVTPRAATVTATPLVSDQQQVPGPVTHVVQEGETLGQIAKKYGVTVGELVALNGLEDANLIRVGQELAVTGRATPRPATTSPLLPGELTRDELDYLENCLPILQGYQGGMLGIAATTLEASRDPTLILDLDWQFDLLSVMALLMANGEAIRSLNPPPRLQAAHEEFVEASQHIDTACWLFAEGVDDLDPDKIEAGAVELERGGRVIRRGGERLEEIRNEIERGGGR